LQAVMRSLSVDGMSDSCMLVVANLHIRKPGAKPATRRGPQLTPPGVGGAHPARRWSQISAGSGG